MEELFIGDTLELSEEGKKQFQEINDELQKVWEANRPFLEEMRDARNVGIRSTQIGALLIMMVKSEG